MLDFGMVDYELRMVGSELRMLLESELRMVDSGLRKD
jgi:hypothetical protein